MMNKDRQDARLKNFKNGIDAEEGRRRREETQLSIRKQKKNDRLSKRRFEIPVSEPTEIQSVESGKVVMSVNELPALMSVIRNITGPAEKLAEATRHIRRMLSVSVNPPVQEVIDAGALPYLVQLLMRTDDFSLQFEALWSLTNVASTNYTSYVADQPNAIHNMVCLLKSPCAEVREQSAWCLGNIAGDGPAYRDKLLEHGCMEPLILNVEQPANDSLLGNMTWTISNLCRGKPHPKLELVKYAIPALVSIVMNSTKNSIIIDALWAISYISDGEDERIDAILKTNNGISARLVQLVSSGDCALMAPAVRILGNFASGNEEQTQSVIDAGLLNIALNVLNSGKKNLRKEMCWLLSNIAAGTPKQIASLMNTKHLSETLITLAVDADWDSRKEAIWAVSNTITGGSDHIVSIVVNQNGIEAMVSVLNVSGETKMILVALDTIQHILTVGEKNNYRYDVTFDECGGIEKLEDLQSHSDQAVYEKVVELIEKFFGEEENGEDENLAPAYDDNAFSFGIASPPPAKVLFESPQPMATTSFGAINNHQFAFGR